MRLESVEGMFRDWDFGYHTIVSPDKKFELWICNGFTSFKDYFSVGKNTQLLLSHIPLGWKRMIWDEYQAELLRRTHEAITKFTQSGEKESKS